MNLKKLTMNRNQPRLEEPTKREQGRKWFLILLMVLFQALGSKRGGRGPWKPTPYDAAQSPQERKCDKFSTRDATNRSGPSLLQRTKGKRKRARNRFLLHLATNPGWITNFQVTHVTLLANLGRRGQLAPIARGTNIKIKLSIIVMANYLNPVIAR